MVLHDLCDDRGTKEALQFLMTREITHLKAFMQALDSVTNNKLVIGQIPPTPGIVEQFYNTSTGAGDEGEEDTTGPWNTGDEVETIESPALSEFQVTSATPKAGKTTHNGNGHGNGRKPKAAKKS